MLKTKKRVYVLYAPTEEERVLWLNGFSRLLGVPVNDPYFTPLEKSPITSFDLPKVDILEAQVATVTQ